MTELVVNPEKLRKTAVTFGGATDTLMALLKNLNEAVEDLEKDWSGVSQEDFFKQYQDLQKYLEAFTKITSNITSEMNSMADHFEKLENKDFDEK